MNSKQDVSDFLGALLEEKERETLLKKISVAIMMSQHHVQTEIAETIGAAFSVIQEVGYAMHHVGTGGYGLVLSNMNAEK